MMQERQRRRTRDSTIRGKRYVRSLPGRLKSRSVLLALRAMTREPSCLISWSESGPEGSCETLVGRHGAMNPAGRVRCNIMAIAKGYSCVSQPFLIARLTLWDIVGLSSLLP